MRSFSGAGIPERATIVSAAPQQQFENERPQSLLVPSACARTRQATRCLCSCTCCLRACGIWWDRIFEAVRIDRSRTPRCADERGELDALWTVYTRARTAGAFDLWATPYVVRWT